MVTALALLSARNGTYCIPFVFNLSSVLHNSKTKTYLPAQLRFIEKNNYPMFGHTLFVFGNVLIFYFATKTVQTDANEQ